MASPLLANIVLNKLDWFLHSKGLHGNAGVVTYRHGRPNLRFTRYADDWCVFLTRCKRQHAERLKDEIEMALLELNPREQQVMRLRFGLDDGQIRTLEEVGREFGVTRERIRQIESKTLAKLRHPTRSQRLRDYLEEA